jgi:hypothetical protein
VGFFIYGPAALWTVRGVFIWILSPVILPRGGDSRHWSRIWCCPAVFRHGLDQVAVCCSPDGGGVGRMFKVCLVVGRWSSLVFSWRTGDPRRRRHPWPTRCGHIEKGSDCDCGARLAAVAAERAR